MKILTQKEEDKISYVLQLDLLCPRGKFLANILKNSEVSHKLFKEILDFIITENHYYEQLDRIKFTTLIEYANLIGYSFSRAQLVSLITVFREVTGDLIEKDYPILDELIRKKYRRIEFQSLKKISPPLNHFILANIDSWIDESLDLEYLFELGNYAFEKTSLSDEILGKVLDAGKTGYFEDYQLIVPEKVYCRNVEKFVTDKFRLALSQVPPKYRALHRFFTNPKEKPPKLSRKRLLKHFAPLLTSANKRVREWATEIADDRYEVLVGNKKFKVPNRLREKLIQLLKIPQKELNTLLLETLKQRKSK